MKIDDIKIFPCYASHPPKWEKMQRKEQFYRETGLFQSEITVDAAGNLLNGYTSYLLAKAAGVEDIPVRVIRRQIVRAHHRRSGKLYTWKLPESLTGQVYAGDRLVVRTGRGLRTVTVIAVDEYTGKEPEPSRMAIRKRKVVSKGGVA